MVSHVTMDDGRQFSIEVTDIGGQFCWKLFEHGMKMHIGTSIGQRGRCLAHGFRKTLKTAMVTANNELVEFIS